MELTDMQNIPSSAAEYILLSGTLRTFSESSNGRPETTLNALKMSEIITTSMV